MRLPQRRGHTAARNSGLIGLASPSVRRRLEGPTQRVHGRAAQWSDQCAFGHRKGRQQQLGTSPCRQDRHGVGGEQVVGDARKTGERWVHDQETAGLAGMTRPAELGAVALHDRGEFIDAARWIDDAHLGRNRSRFAQVFVRFRRSQLFGTEGLEGRKKAVHLSDMDPHQQVRIVGSVRSPVRSIAPHSSMNCAYGRDRTLGIRHSAVRGQRDVSTSALEASPEIAAKACMINDRLQRQRMKGLQEQRTNRTDEHRRIGMDPPNRVLLIEPTLAVSPDFGMLCLEVTSKPVSYGLRDAGLRVDERSDRHVGSVRGPEDSTAKREHRQTVGGALLASGR